MNHLAHVFLARHSEEAMLGAVLGDFVKGSDTSRYPDEVAREIRIHRLVDAYTDAHPATRAARLLFAPAHRRFAGIVLDVYYDHLLSRHWPRFCDEPLAAMEERFYLALGRHQALLPPRLAAVAPRMIAQRWLSGYGSIQGFERTVERLAARLSRQQEVLVASVADVHAHQVAIESGFLAFMPELVHHVARLRADRRETG